MFNEMVVAGRRIRVYPSKRALAPAVYLNIARDDGSDVRKRAFEMGCPDFTLVSVLDLDWGCDLTPWPSDCLTRSDEPYGGGAQAYLRVLEDEVMPRVEDLPPARPAYSVIAGYSLGGLFALWATFESAAFARAVSASGSLWYPGFMEYARAHAFARVPETVYLSLGKREHRTPNRLVRSVERNTQDMLALCRERSVLARLEMNPGNHFQDSIDRMAKGIAWTLRQRRDG